MANIDSAVEGISIEQEIKDSLSRSKQTKDKDSRNDEHSAHRSPEENVSDVPVCAGKKTVQNGETDKTAIAVTESQRHVRKLPQTPSQPEGAEENSKKLAKKAAKLQNESKYFSETQSTVADICAPLEGNKLKVSERVSKIQEALSVATKYSHCFSCLQAKKTCFPDLVCIDCNHSFCFRCSGQHKSAPSNKRHIMLAVPDKDEGNQQAAGLYCLRHRDAELGMYCTNCEVLVCTKCIVDQHLDCPGMVSMHQYAYEEKDAIKMYRVKYAQVVRFFSEQRCDTKETMAALVQKKAKIQNEIRAFFSALMKASMDVEAALLEELEFCVSNQTDLLTEQSLAWQSTQECTTQLLDIIDMLHLLPDADFLPLITPSKDALSKALREGESLAASAPPELTLILNLAQSSKRSVVKRIKEIGATALSISTYKMLTLRKISSVSFSAPGEKEEPLVSAIALLTQTILVAADFNNSCLKLFHKNEDGETWIMGEVLPLKWRPYGIAKISGKHSFMKPIEKVPEKHQNSSDMKADTKTSILQTKSSSQAAGQPDSQEQLSARKPVRKPSNCDEEVLEHIAVSSPFAGCYIIAVPLSGQTNMRIVRSIDEEKGYWGLTCIDERTLAVSTITSGRSFINLLDVDGKKSKRRLPLPTDTALVPLGMPRHILATSPTSVLVGDHAKKAVIHISTDGKILFTFTGHTGPRINHPEGLSMDGQGHLYVADSGDNSISVLTKNGLLFSKTGSQQSDLRCPQTVYVDKNSHLYVANDGGKMLTVFDIIP